MGELSGLPEWAFATLFVLIFVVCVWAIAWRNTRRQIQKTLAKRLNLSHAEFMQRMVSDVSPEAAAFIWDQANESLSFFKATLTCHPDDDFIADLPIVEEEWFEDWPALWANQNGLEDTGLPDWPKDWPTTVRNYGRWLDLSSQTAPALPT